MPQRFILAARKEALPPTWGQGFERYTGSPYLLLGHLSGYLFQHHHLLRLDIASCCEAVEVNAAGEVACIEQN